MRLHVSVQSSEWAGSCNGCDRHAANAKGPVHKVAVITTGMEVRLCRACARELVKELRRVFP